MEIRVEEADFSVAREWEALRGRTGGEMGAVASFVGLVRDRNEEAGITGLYLEHYPGMTEKSIREIVSEAEGRWPLLDVVVIHRVGRLAPRDQIVFVQVASAHRAAAFSACEFIMDFLKTDAVLWKREARGEREHWVEATEQDRQRAEQWRGEGDN